MGMMGAVCSGERESSREQPARAEGLEMEMELFSQLERIHPALEATRLSLIYRQSR